jgi:NAD(P)H-hydrate epimerase
MRGIVSVDERFAAGALPTRRRDAYKGDFGRVAILAGSVGYTGAPVLAANAAVRTGSGLVFLSVPQEIWRVVAVKCDEAMPSPMPRSPGEFLKKAAGYDALLVGPGLGRAPKIEAFLLEVVRSCACPLVLDADGINALAGHIDILDGRRGRLTVLTPHDGEFARLTGGVIPAASDENERVRGAAAFAEAHGCVLVRKGHRTITAFPEGEIFINTTGNPGMAKGGSGDVLAGMILSLLGQGIPPKQAVPAAVWFHGRAGDLCAAEKGEYGMTPTDMIGQIPYAINSK